MLKGIGPAAKVPRQHILKQATHQNRLLFLQGSSSSAQAQKLVICNKCMEIRDALCDSTAGKRFNSLLKNYSALVMDERGQEVMPDFECPHCHQIFHAHCRVLCRTGLSCGKFQEMSHSGKEKKLESMFLELAKKSRWQRCPKFMFYVEKVSGCMSIK